MQINDKWIIRSSICPVSYVASNLLGRLKSFFIYKEIMDAQHFPFYIILSNYVWSILFYQDKNYNVRYIRFHVCIKMRCCKRRACKRKTLAEQLKRYLKFNSFSFFIFLFYSFYSLFPFCTLQFAQLIIKFNIVGLVVWMGRKDKRKFTSFKLSLVFIH